MYVAHAFKFYSLAGARGSCGTFLRIHSSRNFSRSSSGTALPNLVLVRAQTGHIGMPIFMPSSSVDRQPYFSISSSVNSHPQNLHFFVNLFSLVSGCLC